MELPKRDREMQRFMSRRKCPGCGKRFSTRPKFLDHVGAAMVSFELGVSSGEAARLWRTYGSSLIVKDEESGERVIRVPEEEGSKMS